MDMTTIFSKIIAREIPGFFVYEDDICAVIMDKFPATPGQSMVILRREVDYLFSLSDDEYNHLFQIAKRVAIASDKVFKSERSCLVVEGFEVPHVHIKVLPVLSSDKSLAEIMLVSEEESDLILQEQANALRDAMQ